MPEKYPFTVSHYTVGIICALEKELLAVRCLLDSIHSPDLVLPRRDTNSYILGMMGQHMVIATCLPAGEYGTNAAASVASQLHVSFPAVEFCLLVGIAGGVPETNDIRLGDVVVSLPTGNLPGVIQYDMGKAISEDCFIVTGSLQRPPRVLLGAISSLRSNPSLASNPLQPYIDIIVQKNDASRFPGRECDILFKNDCIHDASLTTCDSHLDLQVLRRARNDEFPRVYYGLVASGNKVVRDSSLRDRLGRRYNILCFEMEAAGILNALPCLVIRGICDYSDSHKSKTWQEYAAATAAAYAKLLLTEVRAQRIHGENGASSSDRTCVPNCFPDAQDDKLRVNNSDDHSEFHPSNSIHDPVNEERFKARSQPEPHLEREHFSGGDAQQPSMFRTPEYILLKAESYAERRGLWNPVPTDAMTLMITLKVWAESSGPDILVVEPRNPMAYPRAEDLAFQTIKLISSRGQPLVWALWPECDKPLTSQDITHCITAQIRQSYIGSSITTGQYNSKFYDTTSRLFEPLDKSFVVIEIKEASLALRVLELIKISIIDRQQSLKVLLISYSLDVSCLAATFPGARKQVLNAVPPAKKRKRTKESYWDFIQPRL
ncbi:unnamed protein product [Penicillium salamii]|uniref:Nucleoside phosphorylase domain-containing protein n=1 Tax=Penicillium salamii TaxID=1612424 RepID=A0A9W4JWD1_9EURO|nr:unnamed protein product [Penicillium salamii]